ncbi:MAG: endolytic transglycosylase MltG [Bacteroidota bacterium]
MTIEVQNQTILIKSVHINHLKATKENNLNVEEDEYDISYEGDEISNLELLNLDTNPDKISDLLDDLSDKDNLIKYNKQEKIKLTLNSQIHNLDEFVVYVSDKLELNEDELENHLTDEKKLDEDFQLDPENCFGLIVPGVYEVSWAISGNDFFDTLKGKYTSIWNEKRKVQTKKIGFSIAEVISLASITQSESGIESEQEKIASVYINRLNRGILLQADPTLKFANKNFDAQRILDADKEINSPYNTYKYKGLPPGPICLVYTQAIDAVLNYTKHNFIFFCAKPNLNGFSDFSATYEQHQKFAKAYQKAMDKRGINR